MLVKRIVVGNLKVNCYLVVAEETNQALVIDPGSEADKILTAIADQGCQVEYVVNTHGHADHIAANEELLAATGAQLLIHETDSNFLQDSDLNLSSSLGDPREEVVSPPADRLLTAGDKIKCGALTLEVIYTPGHTPGGICLKTDQELFSGDTIFSQGVGRTDLPHGALEDLQTSLDKIAKLPEDLKLYPGHGPTSTLKKVKRSNPYL
ncbi:MBL fold metallo-hydrolase [Halanaerobaculum tunisiense]